MKKLDQDLMCALVHQVTKAVPKKSGGCESDVTTVITRPLWRRWCRAVGLPKNCEPTGWVGITKTRRVYGSKTIVVESDVEVAISFPSP